MCIYPLEGNTRNFQQLLPLRRDAGDGKGGNFVAYSFVPFEFELCECITCSKIKLQIKIKAFKVSNIFKKKNKKTQCLELPPKISLRHLIVHSLITSVGKQVQRMESHKPGKWSSLSLRLLLAPPPHYIPPRGSHSIVWQLLGQREDSRLSVTIAYMALGKSPCI